MKLFQTLSHMPYLVEKKLLFCTSPGPFPIEIPRSAFDILHNIPARVTTFQPWRLALHVDGVTTNLSHSFPIRSPFSVFCNPVMNKAGEMSFVYGRGIYTTVIEGTQLTKPHRVVGNLFSGFCLDGNLVIVNPPCKENVPQLLINDAPFNTFFDVLLRAIPYGDGIIVTGRKSGVFMSVLYTLQDETAMCIKANGKDVYKCCLDDTADQVIYAKREGEFEARYLHADPVELYEISDFLK